MFPSNKVSLIISFIFGLWVIKINSWFYLNIIIWLFFITWLGIFMNINIIFFIITGWMFITRLSFSIRDRSFIIIIRRFVYFRFTRGMQSPIIFLLIFLSRRTRYISIFPLRVLFNSFWMTFKIKWFLSHFTSSSSNSNSKVIYIVIHFIKQLSLRFSNLF